MEDPLNFEQFPLLQEEADFLWACYYFEIMEYVHLSILTEDSFFAPVSFVAYLLTGRHFDQKTGC
ncbi:hypothetical protein KDW_00440 [Dictyobacter vulcani]|uniref:Uncharacterized protein n=1 Tax=Dictyobacter vulcani TaxID=2607529 RepID=A0A5J4KGN5_9CHLR|nr:hypothetical protein KDW_00440 [Dictyobacter vulcani]